MRDAVSIGGEGDKKKEDDTNRTKKEDDEKQIQTLRSGGIIFLEINFYNYK